MRALKLGGLGCAAFVVLMFCGGCSQLFGRDRTIADPKTVDCATPEQCEDLHARWVAAMVECAQPADVECKREALGVKTTNDRRVEIARRQAAADSDNATYERRKATDLANALSQSRASCAEQLETKNALLNSVEHKLEDAQAHPLCGAEQCVAFQSKPAAAPVRAPVSTAQKDPAPSGGGSVQCRDGSASPTCSCGGSLRGCCSHHGGVAGCK